MVWCVCNGKWWNEWNVAKENFIFLAFECQSCFWWKGSNGWVDNVIQLIFPLICNNAACAGECNYRISGTWMFAHLVASKSTKFIATLHMPIARRRSSYRQLQCITQKIIIIEFQFLMFIWMRRQMKIKMDAIARYMSLWSTQIYGPCHRLIPFDCNVPMSLFYQFDEW